MWKVQNLKKISQLDIQKIQLPPSINLSYSENICLQNLNIITHRNRGLHIQPLVLPYKYLDMTLPKPAVRQTFLQRFCQPEPVVYWSS